MTAVFLSVMRNSIMNMKTISLKARRSFDAASIVSFITRHECKILATAALFSLAGIIFSSEILIFMSAVAAMGAIYPTCKI